MYIRYPTETKRIIHKMLTGRRLMANETVANGTIKLMRLYLSRILMVWIMKWVFEKPITVFGLFLNTLISHGLSLSGEWA